jgi:hypothetical protein
MGKGISPQISPHPTKQRLKTKRQQNLHATSRVVSIKKHIVLAEIRDNLNFKQERRTRRKREKGIGTKKRRKRGEM